MPGPRAPLAIRQRRVNERQHRINQFFVDLTAHAHRAGDAVLHRWWHRVDTARWLHEHGVARRSSDGHGIWIEGGATLSFTLQWLAGELDRFTGEAVLPAEAVAACYAGPVPVDAALVVVGDRTDEQRMQEVAAVRRLRAVLATTTPALLGASADGPAGPVWATEPAATSRHRLIDLRADR